MWLLIDWSINFERDGNEVRGVCQRLFQEEKEEEHARPEANACLLNL